MTPSDLAAKADISIGYASMLLSGERTTCSNAMAVKIYGATGLQFGFLKGLTADQIAPLIAKAA